MTCHRRRSSGVLILSHPKIRAACGNCPSIRRSTDLRPASVTTRRHRRIFASLAINQHGSSLFLPVITGNSTEHSQAPRGRRSLETPPSRYASHILKKVHHLDESYSRIRSPLIDGWHTGSLAGHGSARPLSRLDRLWSRYESAVMGNRGRITFTTT